MPEVKLKEAVEAVKFDPREEIVALYATARLGADKKPKNTTGQKVEIAKAGEAAFMLRAGQFARMKRWLAEWHAAKHKGAIDHTIDLQVKTLEEIEAIRKGQPLPTEQTERDAVVEKLIDAGTIKNADEAEGIDLADLKAML